MHIFYDCRVEPWKIKHTSNKSVYISTWFFPLFTSRRFLSPQTEKSVCLQQGRPAVTRTYRTINNIRRKGALDSICFPLSFTVGCERCRSIVVAKGVALVREPNAVSLGLAYFASTAQQQGRWTGCRTCQAFSAQRANGSLCPKGALIPGHWTTELSLTTTFRSTPFCPNPDPQ